MSSIESDPFDYEHTLENPDANQRRETTDHVRIQNPNGPDELAIFEADEATADGAWISATGESFVALAEKR